MKDMRRRDAARQGGVDYENGFAWRISAGSKRFRNYGGTMASISGTIKRLVRDKGFGFVQAGDGAEYFFHQSACADARFDDLREGQAVTFDKGQGPKGPRAENIRLA